MSYDISPSLSDLLQTVSIWHSLGSSMLLLMALLKVAQSCQTLYDPMGYTVHGILQARILEWIAFPFSRGSSQPRDWTQVSRTAGGFFTSWATREPKIKERYTQKGSNGLETLHRLEKVARTNVTKCSDLTNLDGWKGISLYTFICTLEIFHHFL